MSTPTTSKLTKVYDLQVVGSNEVYSELDRINKLLTEARRNAKALRDELGKSFISDELKKLQDQITKLEQQQADLVKQMKEQAAAAQNNAKIVTEATKQEAAKRVAASKEATDKITADSKRETETKRQQLLEQKKLSEQERTEAARKVKEMKDLQLQQKQAKATQFTAQQNAAPGSYYDIANQYRKLSQDVKSTIPLSDQAAVDAALANLTKLKEQLDNFARNLTKDKTLVGEYSTGVIQAFQKMGLGTMITDQVNTAKKSLDTLNAEFEVLRNELGHVKQTGQGSLDAIERQLVENRQAALQLTEQIDRVEQSLKGVGGIGTQITEALSKEFKGMKQHLMEMVIGFITFQKLIEGIQRSVAVNYELSDSLADIKNRIHGTDEEVQNLLESLKKLDTRTGIQGLVDIAAIVSKKGVAKEEIAGITQAIDNLMLVLGGETGDVKETTSSLVKLVTIFSEDKHVTAENINSIGGAIAKLTTSGVATGGFLIDFAERMGGVRGITGFTIDKVLGLGAALEELGQHAEVSSSAMSQLVVKLFTDTRRYADLTGMSLADFKRSLSTDVIGTLVKVTESLKGNAGEMEHFFEGVEEMHTKGVRMVGVLGDIAANADYARKRMNQATAALHENNLVTDMAANKQSNFAATVDRLKKSLDIAFTSTPVQVTLMAVAGLLTILLNNIGLLVGGLSLYSAAWAIANSQMILAKANTIATTIATTANTAATKVATLFTRAYATTLVYLTDVEVTLANVTKGLWLLMAENPFGAIMIILGAVLASFTALNGIMGGTTKELKEYARNLSIAQEIEARAAMATVEQVNKLNVLNKVLQSTVTGYEAKKKALDELQKAYPAYHDVLIDETGKVIGLAEAYKKVTGAIRAKAEAQAAEALSAEKRKDVMQVETLKQRVQTESAIQRNDKEKGWSQIYIDKLSAEEQAIISQVMDKVNDKLAEQGKSGRLTYSSKGITFPAIIAKDINDALQVIEAGKEKIAQQYEQAAASRAGIHLGSIGDAEDVNKQGGDGTRGKSRLIKDIEDDITHTTEQLKKSVAFSKEAIALQKQLRDLQAEYNRAMGIENFNKGARLRPDEYETFKMIDAERDTKIAALRTAYMETDEVRKVYNGKIIHNEFSFQQELQQIEESALHRKIAALNGNRPAEVRARAQYNLQLLESQKAYLDKFYKMEVDEEKKRFEDYNQFLKKQKEIVDNTFGSTDLEKAEAQRQLYINLLDEYKSYIKIMERIEEEYNKKSIDNDIERGLKRQEMERSILLSEKQMIEERIKARYKEIETGYDDRMRGNMDDKIKTTKGIIASDMGPGEKKHAMEEAGREFDKKAIDTEQIRIEQEEALNQQLYDQQLINATTYYEQLDKLRERNLNNAIRAYDLEQEEAARNHQMVQKAVEGAIGIVQTIGSEMLAQEQRNADLQMQREQRAMDWNKKVLDSQVQSHEQQRANDVAFHLAQEQMAKKKAQEDKKRAMEQMAMEYAVAAFRIVAANLWKGPEGWAEIAIEEGILAATYGLKLAFLSNAQTFGDGGEVPGGGGQFGGKPHGAGGTPFIFRGRQFEAEAGELAIINKRSSSNTGVFTFSGTPKQIASGLNALGGGVNFAPGWSGGQLPTFDYGGMLGADLRMPDMIFRHAIAKETGNSGGMQDVKDSIAVLTANVAMLTSNINNVAAIPVQLDPHGLNAYNYNHQKAVQIGKI